jgi:hypothetical protein
MVRVRVKRMLAAAGAAAVLTGGALAGSALTAPAGASVQVGNHIEVGCSTVFDVLVYTVIDNQGHPTGSMDSIGWACSHGPTDSLDLQNYVRVSQDQFGNVLIREFPGRLARGTPIALNVVPGWEKNHEH